MTDRGKEPLGLYIHIPFCLRKCLYCDFYSGAADAGQRAAYVAALCAHLRGKSRTVSGVTVDTVYIGGGTPTVLSERELAEVLGTIRDCYSLAPEVEVTVECNPATGSRGLFETLRGVGVNRLSVGLQSAHDSELRALGRPHDGAAFTDTVRAARAAGIENISADLMFGIPGQTLASLSESVDFALSHGISHLSAYGLRVEEGTPFFAMREGLALPPDDTVADMQLLVAERLRAAGFLHYEVSNYALPGRESRHNLSYWLSAPYLGFGPGAHSYFDGVRFSTPSDRTAYVAAVERGDFAVLEAERQVICGRELRDEYVMLRMRLFRGIEKADFLTRFGVKFEETYGGIEKLIAGGFLVNTPHHIAFTEKGMYVSNAILSDWLDFSNQ